MYQRATAPQSIGGVLDSGFKLFRSSFKETYWLAAVSALIVAPVGTFGERLAGTAPTTGVLLGFVLALIVVVGVAVVFSGAIFARVDAVANDLELPAAAALSYGAQRAPALFVASLCYGLAVTLGLVLLLIPGIIFTVWYVFGLQITVIERLGPIASLSRSRQLVRGHWWRTAAVLTVIAIIISVVYVILGIVAGMAVVMNPDEILQTGTMPWYVDYVVSPLLAGITTPLAYSMAIAVYYDLKNRHEGGDIAERIAASA